MPTERSPHPVIIALEVAVLFAAAEAWLVGDRSHDVLSLLGGTLTYAAVVGGVMLMGAGCCASVGLERDIRARLLPSLGAGACVGLLYQQWFSLRLNADLPGGRVSALFSAGFMLVPLVATVIGAGLERLLRSMGAAAVISAGLLAAGSWHALRNVAGTLGRSSPLHLAAAASPLIALLICGLAARARRRWRLPLALLWLGLALVLAPLRFFDPAHNSGAPEGAARPEGERPDIVLITVDTLRADAIDWWRTDGATPALARFGQRARVAAAASATSPWTYPSMASLFTGRWSTEHEAVMRPNRRGGIIGGGIASELPMLGEQLRDAGYRTSAVVSNPHLTHALGFDRGFERFFSSFEAPRLRLLPGRGAWEGLLGRVHPDDIYRAELLSDAAPLVERAREELTRPDDGRPLFLWLHLLDPHIPYGQAEDPTESLAARASATPLLDEPAYGEMLAYVKTRDVRWGTMPVAEPDRELWRAAYRLEVAYVDETLSPFLSDLEERDAAVLFTSDHGEELFDHGGYGHGHALWGEVTDVPLALSVPGVEPGTIEERVSLLDAHATMLAIAGVEPPGEGRDLRGPVPAAPVWLEFPNFFAPQRAVIVDEWKLVEELPTGDRRFQLYDLRADPTERVDLWPTVQSVRIPSSDEMPEHQELLTRASALEALLATREAHWDLLMESAASTTESERGIMRSIGYLAH